MNDNQSAENRNIAAGRTPDGKFISGNPGRVPGSRNKVSSATMAEIKTLAPTALTVLKENLEKNCAKSAIYILDKVLPASRTVELENADVTSIIKALTSGEISPDEGKVIAQSIARLREIEELDRVKDRLAEIEKILKG